MLVQITTLDGKKYEFSIYDSPHTSLAKVVMDENTAWDLDMSKVQVVPPVGSCSQKAELINLWLVASDRVMEYLRDVVDLERFAHQLRFDGDPGRTLSEFLVTT
jgi:hypothetical protein